MTNRLLLAAGLAASALTGSCTDKSAIPPTQEKAGQNNQTKINKDTLFVIDEQMDDSAAKIGAKAPCGRPNSGMQSAGVFTTSGEIESSGVCKDDAGRPLTYIRFQFELGSSELSREAQRSVYDLKRMIDRTGQTGITLTGNADGPGDKKSDILLSWDRANSVATALKKIAPKINVSIEARGSDSCPTNGTNLSSPDCRRVTISIGDMVYSNG